MRFHVKNHGIYPRCRQKGLQRIHELIKSSYGRREEASPIFETPAHLQKWAVKENELCSLLGDCGRRRTES